MLATASCTGVLDPAAFASDGGPSIAERIYDGSGRRCSFRRADNSRVGKLGAMGGWDQVRQRLVGEDDKPMLYIFNTCPHIIRTLPSLQHDINRPEDVDTDGEDHAPDALRYGCMSRPFLRTHQSKPAPKFGIQHYTMDDLWREHGKGRGVSRI